MAVPSCAYSSAYYGDVVAKVTIKVNPTRVQQVLGRPNGQLARGMLRLTKKVHRQAKKNLNSHNRTGALSASLFARVVHRGGVPIGQVGTPLRYGFWLDQGTGIYGPRHTPIVPVRAKYLRFTTRTGRVVYAKSVRGIRPTKFLRNSLNVLKA